MDLGVCHLQSQKLSFLPRGIIPVPSAYLVFGEGHGFVSWYCSKFFLFWGVKLGIILIKWSMLWWLLKPWLELCMAWGNLSNNLRHPDLPSQQWPAVVLSPTQNWCRFDLQILSCPSWGTLEETRKKTKPITAGWILMGAGVLLFPEHSSSSPKS